MTNREKRAEQSRAEQSRAEQSRAEFGCVDVLKGLAILAVLAVHTAQSFDLPVLIGNIAKMGQLGCQLFFVVSGFTIANSWYSKEQKVSSFYLRRWKSIAPGYYTMIAIYWVFDCVRKLIGHDQHIVFWKGAIINALFLNGFFPEYNNTIVPGGWFIGTTAIFYLSFPLLIKLLSMVHRKTAYIIPVGVALGCFAVGNAYPKIGENGSFFYYSFIVQSPAIILGILLFFDYKKGMVLNRDKAVKWSFGSAIVSIILFYFNVNGAFMMIPLFSGVCFYMLFTIFLKSNGNKELVMLGKKSYGMFLTHMFFAHQMSAILSRFGRKIGVCQTVCFAIAYMTTIAGSYCASVMLNKLNKKVCESIHLS